MPSSHMSAAVRPSSPLSPREPMYRYEGAQTSSLRLHPGRNATTQQRRSSGQSLMLPGLPRFHPANYPSPHSSVATTPGSGPTSPQLPLSPSMQQKVYNDAQKQLYLYQREAYMGRSTTTAPMPREGPASPRLCPLGSPGPVTPLELEEEDNYMAAGSRSSGRATFHEQADELHDKLAHAVSRQRESSPRAMPASPKQS